ncbi:MAG: hypothetical protein GYB68_05515 [Chloroflexi bacterium]|nr:hypothetical protein [Chloroflexota bacterium]
MPKSALPDWVKKLTILYRVVAPVPKHGQIVFDEITDPSTLTMLYPQSVLPPKKYLFPQHEVMLNYKLDGSWFEANIESEPTVVLGIHTCDLHAVKLFDRIFSQGYADQHYQARRDDIFLVSIECLTPCTDESFCRSMGTLSATSVFDLHLIDLGEDYAIEIGSDRGESLLNGFKNVFNATSTDEERVNDRLKDKWAEFPYRLDFDVTELSGLLAENFSSEYWDELGEICLACGQCTQVCPTCYCFDITDERSLTGEIGQRTRTWDSCQIDMFAEVAGGHNFRKSRAARQRHRFMRKGKYQMDAYGLVGCVGCGRCAEACLVGITPVKTFNAIHKRQLEKEEA